MAEKVVAETEELPKAIVRRVVKEKLSQLSNDGDISVFREALQAFSESARIFIHYLSATANDICKESKRQTINADDVFKALEEIEFPEFVGPLKASLEANGTRGHLAMITYINISELGIEATDLEGDLLLVKREFRQKNAGKRSAYKAKEAIKKKEKVTPVENGGEDKQDNRDEMNEDENNTPAND
ncbi:unnamed protein product [Camellia sinensis]